MLTAEQITQLCNCLNEARATETADAVMISATTKMRLREILSIQWADVDWDNGVLGVFDSKSQVRSSIPINNSIRSVLERRRHLSPGPFGDLKSPVLLGKAVHRINMAFGRACAQIGLRPLSFSSLRHCQVEEAK
jgi:integrase